MSRKVALAFRKTVKAAPYQLALTRAGLEPVQFAPEAPGTLTDVSALVLTGGDDVEPALYGAARHPETEPPDRERDDYEAELLRAALSRDMPVLAICRGLQLFNVARGGTLIQHLDATAKHRQRTGGKPVHDVMVEQPLERILGTRRAQVNSRHHQAVGRLGEGLIVTARDPDDGVIEGFVLPGQSFAVAVQWHPEDMVDDPVQLRLFSALREAAGQ